jgi:hypothetical protein
MRCPPGNKDEVAALSLWLLSILLLVLCMSIPEYVVQESDLRCDDGSPLHGSSQQGAFYGCVSFTKLESSCRLDGVNLTTSTQCEQLHSCSSLGEQSLVSGLSYDYDPCSLWLAFRAFLVLSLLLTAPTVGLCCWHLHKHGSLSAAPGSEEQLSTLLLGVLSVWAGLLSIVCAAVLYAHEQPVMGFYFHGAQGPATAVGASFFLQCIACVLTLVALLPWWRQRRRQIAATYQLQQQQEVQHIAAVSASASASPPDAGAVAAARPACIGCGGWRCRHGACGWPAPGGPCAARCHRPVSPSRGSATYACRQARKTLKHNPAVMAAQLTTKRYNTYSLSNTALYIEIAKDDTRFSA